MALAAGLLLVASGTAQAFFCMSSGADNRRMHRPAPYIPWPAAQANLRQLPPIIQPAAMRQPRKPAAGTPVRYKGQLWRPIN